MRYEGCFSGALVVAVAISFLGTACDGTTPVNTGDKAVSAAHAKPGGIASGDDTVRDALPRGVHRRGAPRLHSRRGLTMSRALMVKGSGYAEYTLCATGKSCADHLATTTLSAQFTEDTTSPDAGADAGGDAGTAPCTTTVSGSCQVSTCSYSAGTGPAGVAAGELTVGGGKMGNTRVPSNELQDYVYSFLQVGSAFSAGETLTLSGSGGKVPSFPAQSLVAPGAITLTAPTTGPHGGYTVPTTASLSLTWTGGTAGDTVFVEGVAYGATAETYFDCSWDATAGTASVPSSILAPLAGQGGEFVWGQQTAPVTFSAGTYTVAYLADVVGTAPATFE